MTTTSSFVLVPSFLPSCISFFFPLYYFLLFQILTSANPSHPMAPLCSPSPFYPCPTFVRLNKLYLSSSCSPFYYYSNCTSQLLDAHCTKAIAFAVALCFLHTLYVYDIHEVSSFTKLSMVKSGGKEILSAKKCSYFFTIKTFSISLTKIILNQFYLITFI